MIGAIVLLCLLLASSAEAHRTNIPFSPACSSGPVSAAEFRPWAKAVWGLERWRRGDPKASTIAAYHAKLRCAAGPRNRQAMQEDWHRKQSIYFAHRHKMLWLAEFKPFVYPDGTRWAVPWPIAVCESGENYFVGPAGAYGLILEPAWMSPKEQDEAAHRLFEQYGEAPWAPYESGCAYR